MLDVASYWSNWNQQEKNYWPVFDPMLSRPWLYTLISVKNVASRTDTAYLRRSASARAIPAGSC